MKKLITYLLLLLINLTAYSQYGNEWIDYNQKYYSFKVVETGLHRISYETIQASGIPINNINLNELKLYGREKQIPIYIETGDTPPVDSTD